jgi:hypothetical protein
MLAKSKMLSIVLFLLIFSKSAFADVVLSNVSGGGGIGEVGTFGRPNTSTYGDVFTAPITSELTSFTLFLSSGVGNILGGVGSWNGSGVSSVVYTSAPVTSSETNTFSPDIPVQAGQRYVAFISVDGIPGDSSSAEMQFAAQLVTGIDNFVFNNGGFEQDTFASSNWDGSANNDVPVLFSATFLAAVPEPSTWAMMILGFLVVGFMAYRRKGTHRFA